MSEKQGKGGSSPAESWADRRLAAVERIELDVPAEARGERLDRHIAGRIPDLSRSYVQRLIRNGLVLVGGRPTKPGRELKGGERVEVSIPDPGEMSADPEDIPLEVLHEDDSIIVVNKPAGMVVHPGHGHPRGTLVNALAWRCRSLSSVGGPLRAGIVHRLDRDTSGVIVAAKGDDVHRRLAEQFAGRTVRKEYLAIVRGKPSAEKFSSGAPLGRHPKMRLKITVRHDGGREALTEFEVMAASRSFALLKALPKTGRTHQIRVHLSRLGLPILCDPLYGKESAITASELRGGKPVPGEPAVISRHALHAFRIEFDHPVMDSRVAFSAPPPADFEAAARIVTASRIPPNGRPDTADGAAEAYESLYDILRL